MESAWTEQDSSAGRLVTAEATAVVVGRGSRGSSSVQERAKNQSRRWKSKSTPLESLEHGKMLKGCGPTRVNTGSARFTQSVYQAEPGSYEKRLKRQEPLATRLALDAWSTAHVERVSEVTFAGWELHPGMPQKFGLLQENTTKGVALCHFMPHLFDMPSPFH